MQPYQKNKLCEIYASMILCGKNIKQNYLLFMIDLIQI